VFEKKSLPTFRATTECDERKTAAIVGDAGADARAARVVVRDGDERKIRHAMVHDAAAGVAGVVAGDRAGTTLIEPVYQLNRAPPCGALVIVERAAGDLQELLLLIAPPSHAPVLFCRVESVR
jgi:hypothetical protein